MESVVQSLSGGDRFPRAGKRSETKALKARLSGIHAQSYTGTYNLQEANRTLVVLFSGSAGEIANV